LAEAAAVLRGSLHWPKPPQFSGGSLPWPKPPQFSGGSSSRPKPVRFPVDPCPDRSPFSSPEERCLGRSLLIPPLESLSRPKPVQVSRSAVAAEALAALPDPGLGRSPCRSPFGSPRPAEALAVHLSGKPVPAEADRCFPAGKSVSRNWHSFRLALRQSRSFGGLPPKRRAGRSRSVSPVGSPSGPKSWRFTSEAPCQPKLIGFSGAGSPPRAEAPAVLLWQSREARRLLVPPGCSTKHANLAKAWGKPVASAWRRLRQPPSP